MAGLPEVDDSVAQLLHLRQAQPQLAAGQRQQPLDALVAARRPQRFHRLVQRQLLCLRGQQGVQAARVGHLPQSGALQVQLQQEGALWQGGGGLAAGGRAVVRL